MSTNTRESPDDPQFDAKGKSKWTFGFHHCFGQCGTCCRRPSSNRQRVNNGNTGLNGNDGLLQGCLLVCPFCCSGIQVGRTFRPRHISMSLTLISSLVTPYVLETIPDKRVHRMSPSVRIANSPNQTARLMRQMTRDKPRVMGRAWLK
jgi:hypothetical protein